ncbi:MAG TPA: hypothetical protein VNM87_09190 [Candidatus Udaeobacter sp.]|nr:hypothetical protein [Candidatus Udaeobacter sp.]
MRYQGSLRFDASPLLVILGFVLLEIALAYPGAVVEADSVRVGYGIINGIITKLYFAARDLYGRSFSYGYYALFWGLYPRLFNGFESLGAVMNGLNLISTAGALWVFHRWVKALFGGPVALASLLLISATPVVFELGGYGHPEGPAFLALNLAILALVRGAQGGPRAIHHLAVVGWGFAAAALRADVLLAFPALPFLAAAAAPSGRRGRAFVWASILVGLAIGAFFAAQSWVVAMTPARIMPVPNSPFTGKVGMTDILIEYWRLGTSLGALTKGLAVWLTGLGPVLFVLGWIAILAALRGRQRLYALTALAMILPSAIFWLSNPTPSRHLLLTFLALVPAAALWLQAVTRRPYARTVLLVLALNLVAMDAIYPILVRNYHFYFVNLLPRRVNLWVPMGNPITARIWARKQVALELDQMRQLANTTEPRVLVCGAWVSMRLVHELYARGDYQVDYLWKHDSFLYHITTPRTEYLIYDYGGPPALSSKELLERVAAAGDYRDYAIAIAPSDQPVDGPAVVPPGYRELPIALPAGISRD